MAIKNLEDLFEHTLKDIYFAENHIHKHLPDMIKKASNSKLKKALEDHRKETAGHIDRLKTVFEAIGKKAEGEECPAIEGIVKEASELLSEIKDNDTCDAAIISAAQAVEHYEITRYGTLITWAEELGLDKKVASLLGDTLDEEESADEKLTKSRRRPDQREGRLGALSSGRENKGRGCESAPLMTTKAEASPLRSQPPAGPPPPPVFRREPEADAPSHRSGAVPRRRRRRRVAPQVARRTA